MFCAAGASQDSTSTRRYDFSQDSRISYMAADGVNRVNNLHCPWFNHQFIIDQIHFFSIYSVHTVNHPLCWSNPLFTVLHPPFCWSNPLFTVLNLPILLVKSTFYSATSPLLFRHIWRQGTLPWPPDLRDVPFCTFQPASKELLVDRVGLGGGVWGDSPCTMVD